MSCECYNIFDLFNIIIGSVIFFSIFHLISIWGWGGPHYFFYGIMFFCVLVYDISLNEFLEVEGTGLIEMPRGEFIKVPLILINFCFR